MNRIKELSMKLRAAANVLDSLIEIEGTPEIANKILTKKKKRTWSKEQRAKFIKSMRANRVNKLKENK